MGLKKKVLVFLVILEDVLRLIQLGRLMKRNERRHLRYHFSDAFMFCCHDIQSLKWNVSLCFLFFVFCFQLSYRLDGRLHLLCDLPSGELTFHGRNLIQVNWSSQNTTR